MFDLQSDENLLGQTWTFLAARETEYPSPGLGGEHGSAPEDVQGVLPYHAANLASLGAKSITVIRGNSLLAVMAFPSVASVLDALTVLMAEPPGTSAAQHPLMVGVATGEVPMDSRAETSQGFQRAVSLAELAGAGQALIASATFEIARDTAPDEFGFRDCGTVHLPGQARRERVYQLSHPSIPSKTIESLGEDRVVNTIPKGMGYFVGRESEFTAVLRGLDIYRVVQIVGPGAIGKTHLACRVGGELVGSAGEGVLWVSLEGCRNAEQILERIGDSLGGVRRFPYSLEMDVSKQLRGRDLLIVLDRCESCVAPLAGVLATLCASSGPRFVATTSKRIPMTDADIVRLGPMILPPKDEPLSADDLESYESTALFMDRAREVRSTFTAGEDARAIADIVRRLDGHPLAILLAAKRTRSHSPQQILANLGPIIGVNGEKKTSGEPPRKSLRDALRYSSQNLSSCGNLMLRRLSIFQGAWTPLDAAVIADLDVPEVELVLNELVEAGMVETVDGPDGKDCYRFPAQVAAFASSLLTGFEREEVQERHCLRFIDMLAQASKHLNGPFQWQHLDYLDFYRGDLALAFRFMLAEGRHLLSFVDAMVLSWSFWYKRNRIPEALQLIERAIKSNDAIDKEGISKLLNIAGVLANKGGDSAKARSYYRRALQTSRNAVNPGVLAMISTNLAILEWSEDNAEVAIKLFDGSIEVWQNLERKHYVAQSLASSVAALLDLGRVEEAEKRLVDSQLLGLAAGNSLEKWALEVSKAQIALAKGRSSEALPHIAASISCARDAGDDISLARSLIWLAQAAVEQERWEVAGALLGAIAGYAKSAEAYLYRTNELRIARIEGRVRAAIGDARVRELRLMGSLSQISELLMLAQSV